MNIPYYIFLPWSSFLFLHYKQGWMKHLEHKDGSVPLGLALKGHPGDRTSPLHPSATPGSSPHLSLRSWALPWTDCLVYSLVPCGYSPYWPKRPSETQTLPCRLSANSSHLNDTQGPSWTAWFPCIKSPSDWVTCSPPLGLLTVPSPAQPSLNTLPQRPATLSPRIARRRSVTSIASLSSNTREVCFNPLWTAGTWPRAWYHLLNGCLLLGIILPI